MACGVLSTGAMQTRAKVSGGVLAVMVLGLAQAPLRAQQSARADEPIVEPVPAPGAQPQRSPEPAPVLDPDAAGTHNPPAAAPRNAENSQVWGDVEKDIEERGQARPDAAREQDEPLEAPPEPAVKQRSPLLAGVLGAGGGLLALGCCVAMMVAPAVPYLGWAVSVVIYGVGGLVLGLLVGTGGWVMNKFFMDAPLSDWLWVLAVAVPVSLLGHAVAMVPLAIGAVGSAVLSLAAASAIFGATLSLSSSTSLGYLGVGAAMVLLVAASVLSSAGYVGFWLFQSLATVASASAAGGMAAFRASQANKGNKGNKAAAGAQPPPSQDSHAPDTSESDDDDPPDRHLH